MFVECRHILPRGTKCKAAALKGRPYCYFHDQLHTYTQDGRRDDAGTFCLPSIEDASGIQLALTQVMNAMANHRLDSREGVRLIYGLQVVLQAFAGVPKTPPQEIVQATSCDGIGADLAAEKTRCEPHPECPACANRFSCQNVARQNHKSFRNLVDTERVRSERAEREPLALPATACNSAPLYPDKGEPSAGVPFERVLAPCEEGTPVPLPPPPPSLCLAWEQDPFQPRSESVDPQKEADIEARINKFRPDKREADRVARYKELDRLRACEVITADEFDDLLDHPEMPLPPMPKRKGNQEWS